MSLSYTTLKWRTLDTNSYGSNSRLLHVIIKPCFLKRKTNIETHRVLVENENWSLLWISRMRIPPHPQVN